MSALHVAVAGVATSIAVLLAVGLGGHAEEGVTIGLWLMGVCLTAAACGYRSPKLGWLSGAIVVAVQPVALGILDVVLAEHGQRTGSTGGGVGVCIATAMMFLASPLPMSCAHLATLLRRGRDAQRESDLRKD